LLGINRVKQDGWGSRRQWLPRDFCRLLGQEALKASFRKNSGTIK
jgi:hypothetical protein